MMDDYKIKSRIWIEAGDNVLVGEGRIKLLKAIDAEGLYLKQLNPSGCLTKKLGH